MIAQMFCRAFRGWFSEAGAWGFTPLKLIIVDILPNGCVAIFGATLEKTKIPTAPRFRSLGIFGVFLSRQKSECQSYVIYLGKPANRSGIAPLKLVFNLRCLSKCWGCQLYIIKTTINAVSLYLTLQKRSRQIAHARAALHFKPRAGAIALTPLLIGVAKFFSRSRGLL